MFKTTTYSYVSFPERDSRDSQVSLVAKEHPVPQPGPHEVLDLKKSMEFFTKLGYMFNKQFTDETAACMVIGEDIFAMLLTEAEFKGFTPNPICDARKKYGGAGAPKQSSQLNSRLTIENPFATYALGISR
jgi:hypothetical protein